MWGEFISIKYVAWLGRFASFHQYICGIALAPHPSILISCAKFHLLSCYRTPGAVDAAHNDDSPLGPHHAASRWRKPFSVNYAMKIEKVMMAHTAPIHRPTRTIEMKHRQRQRVAEAYRKAKIHIIKKKRILFRPCAFSIFSFASLVDDKKKPMKQK